MELEIREKHATLPTSLVLVQDSLQDTVQERQFKNVLLLVILVVLTAGQRSVKRVVQDMGPAICKSFHHFLREEISDNLINTS